METPETPASPASPAAEKITRRSRALRFLLSVRTLIALAACVATAVVVWRTWELDKQAQLLREANARLVDDLAAERAENKMLTDKVNMLQRDVDAMTPPTNDKLFTILSKGFGVSEVARRTTSVGTTPDAAFATDLTTAQQSDAFTQEFLVQNTDTHTPAQNLCVGSIAWSSGGGATCALKCAAAVATLTCSGAATDGWQLVPGQAREFREDGTNCVCVVGSAAGTTYQDERAIR